MMCFPKKIFYPNEKNFARYFYNADASVFCF